MSVALEQSAADYVMPDLERIGGVSGWRQAAEIAQSRGIKMSSHLFPETSAHLLAATPTCHYLEYVDWANVLLEEPLADRRWPRDRAIASRQRHGLGQESGRTFSNALS